MLTPIPSDRYLEHEDQGREIVDRDYLQAQIDLWDKALSTAVPSEDRDEPVRAFQLDDVMTAPQVDSGNVSPTRIYLYDGFLPRPAVELTEQLTAAVREVVRAQIDVDTDRIETDPPRQARRVYVFADPVHEAQSANGELYVPGPEDTLNKWTPGTPTTILVELLPAQLDDTTEPAILNVQCRVTGSRATWTPVS
jgi:hypothetical protein